MKLLFRCVAILSTLLVSSLSSNEVLALPSPPIIRCPGGHLETLVFSSDGTWIAVAYFDLHEQKRLVGVWDATSLRPIFIDRDKAGSKVGIETLAFSPDDKQLLALGDSQESNELLIWDTASGKRIKEQTRPRQRHNPNLHYLGQTRELLRGTDGRLLLNDTVAGLLTDVETEKVVHDYDKKFPDREPIGFGNGGIIVSSDRYGPYLVYDAVTGKLINAHPQKKGCVYNMIDFSGHGMIRSAYTSKEGFIITKGDPAKKSHIRFDIRSKKPDGTRLSPDGRWLAISYQYWREKMRPVPALFPGEYEYQQIFDTNTGRPVCDAIGGMEVYFSPQGDRMAVVNKDDHIAIMAVPASTP